MIWSNWSTWSLFETSNIIKKFIMHKKDMKQSETPLTLKRCLKLRVISIVFRRHSKCPIGIFSSKIFSYTVYVDKYLYVYSSQKCICKKSFLIFQNTNMCDCGLLHKRLWFMPLTTAITLDCHHRRTHLALIISIHENMRKRWDRFRNITWYCQSLLIILGLR